MFHPIQREKDNNPARDAVVRSLQEATMEMELQIRELEEKEQPTKLTNHSLRQLDKQINDRNTHKETTTTKTVTTTKTDKRQTNFNGSSKNTSLKHTESDVNKTHVDENVSPPTPPPSPPANEDTKVDHLTSSSTKLQQSSDIRLSNKENISASKSDNLSMHYSNNTKNTHNTPKAESTNGLSFTIKPYGSTEDKSSIQMIQTKVWEPSPRKPVITTSAKPAILLSSRPLNIETEFIDNPQKSNSISTEKSTKFTVSSTSSKQSSKTVEKNVFRGKTSGGNVISKSFPSSVFNKSSKQSYSPTYVSEEQPSPPPLDVGYKKLKEDLAASSKPKDTVRVY